MTAIGSTKALGKLNEDRIFIRANPNFLRFRDEFIDYYSLFDGHGDLGHASEMLCTILFRQFSRQMHAIQHKEKAMDSQLALALALRESFVRADLDLQSCLRPSSEACEHGCTDLKFLENPCEHQIRHLPEETRLSAREGSTGTVVLLAEKWIMCANVGDSDCYVIFKNEGKLSIEKLTKTHCLRPSNPDWKRLKERKALGRIGGGLYVQRKGSHSVNMSRAFGDFGLKGTEDPLLSCVPSVSTIERTDQVYAFIIGSDGLWDNLRASEVLRIFENVDDLGGSPERCARALLNTILERKREHDKNPCLPRPYKPDDISIIVKYLQPDPTRQKHGL